MNLIDSISIYFSKRNEDYYCPSARVRSPELVTLLEQQDGFEEVVAVSRAEEVLPLAGTTDDWVVAAVDSELIDLEQLLFEVRSNSPDILIVLLADSLDRAALHKAQHYRAASVVSVNAQPECLALSLRLVCQGHIVVHLPGINNIFELMDGASRASHHNLTEREQEVLALLAQGASNHQIASRLLISVNTAKFHVQNILNKLDCANRHEAARYAVDSGLVRPPPQRPLSP